MPRGGAGRPRRPRWRAAPRRPPASSGARPPAATALDVTRPRSRWRAGPTVVESAWGGVDVLVSNAGVYPADALPRHDPSSSWDAVLDVNLRGAFVVCQRFARGMVTRGEGGVDRHHRQRVGALRAGGRRPLRRVEGRAARADAHDGPRAGAPPHAGERRVAGHRRRPRRSGARARVPGGHDRAWCRWGRMGTPGRRGRDGAARRRPRPLDYLTGEERPRSTGASRLAATASR
jgi:hypothetical protein